MGLVEEPSLYHFKGLMKPKADPRAFHADRPFLVLLSRAWLMLVGYIYPPKLLALNNSLATSNRDYRLPALPRLDSVMRKRGAAQPCFMLWVENGELLESWG